MSSQCFQDGMYVVIAEARFRETVEFPAPLLYRLKLNAKRDRVNMLLHSNGVLEIIIPMEDEAFCRFIGPTMWLTCDPVIVNDDEDPDEPATTN
jgi:hypothetical protein